MRIGLSTLLLLGLLLLVLGLYYYAPHSDQTIYKVTVIAGTLVLARILIASLEFVISRRVASKRRSYELKKIAAYSVYALVLFAMVFIAIGDPQAFAVTIGLIATGLVVVFQEPIVSLAAFVYINVAKPYSVGDRIEMEDQVGDVIDIGPFFTRTIEIRNWVKADQTTGRIVTIPNGHIFRKHVSNYTRHFDFIWDEISIPVTYQSDWKKA
ncbi:MAG: mechanosensitive ion channel domain-containing protein, partial [Candidatus Micrarchaeota archaeon]